MLTYRHIKWGLVWKLLQRAFSWHPWIPGTHKLDSILSLFKCERGNFADVGFFFKKGLLKVKMRFKKQVVAKCHGGKIFHRNGKVVVYI